MLKPIKFVKTTFELWTKVPAKPPLWKCMVVAWLLTQHKPNAQVRVD